MLASGEEGPPAGRRVVPAQRPQPVAHEAWKISCSRLASPLQAQPAAVTSIAFSKQPPGLLTSGDLRA